MPQIELDQLLLQRREAVRHAMVDYRGSLDYAISESQSDNDTQNWESSQIELAAAMRVLWMERT